VFAKIVEPDVLMRLVGGALGAGIGVTAVFALVILGGSRFTDMRRAGSPVAAGAFGVLAVVALVAFVGAVALGIAVMVRK
jgi:hypothetical protein